MPELLDQPAVGRVLAEPALERQLRPVIDQALVGEFDRAVFGDQQAGIDQAAEDTIRRWRQRGARDHPPEQALAFDGAIVDPDQVARERAPQGAGLLGRGLRVIQRLLQLGRDGALHAAERPVLLEGEAPIRSALVVQGLERVGQQRQGVGRADVLDDVLGEPGLELEAEAFRRLLDDLSQRADSAQGRLA